MWQATPDHKVIETQYFPKSYKTRHVLEPCCTRGASVFVEGAAAPDGEGRIYAN